MIRVSLAALLCLTACQQAGTSTNNAISPSVQANAANTLAANKVEAGPPAPQNQIASANVAVPASYDWHFVTEGGSGDLDFGDGDWAEGDKLLSFSCLPGSGSVELGGTGGATLRAGGQSVTIAADASTPVTHPVIAALRSSGEVTVVSGGSERRLAAKAAGRRELERFFAYCNTGAGR